MPTIGSVELLVILLVAFLVVGPRDLPRMMRTVGSWTKRVRVMAMEFQHNLDAVVKEADLEDLKHDALAIKREADGVRNSISEPMREMTKPLPEKGDGENKMMPDKPGTPAQKPGSSAEPSAHKKADPGAS